VLPGPPVMWWRAGCDRRGVRGAGTERGGAEHRGGGPAWTPPSVRHESPGRYGAWGPADRAGGGARPSTAPRRPSP